MFWQVFLYVACFAVVSKSVIPIYCPLYCTCHDSVWKCSDRRVTTWPLDNYPHIIMHGITALDMSKSNIDVLPNWRPTHNFPDLKMVFLGDTVFDTERCRELECLEKLGLFVLSSCPSDRRQGCAPPCCSWSEMTTYARPSSTTLAMIPPSTSTKTTLEMFTLNIDQGKGIAGKPDEEGDQLVVNISTDASLVDHDGAWQWTAEITVPSVANVVYTDISEPITDTAIITNNFDHNFPSDVRETFDMHFIEATVIQSATSSIENITVSLLPTPAYSSRTTKKGQDILTTGDNARLPRPQSTPYRAPVTDITEYIGLFETVLKPIETAPTKIPLLSSSARLLSTASVLKLSSSRRRTTANLNVYSKKPAVATGTSSRSTKPLLITPPEPTQELVAERSRTPGNIMQIIQTTPPMEYVQNLMVMGKKSTLPQEFYPPVKDGTHTVSNTYTLPPTLPSTLTTDLFQDVRTTSFYGLSTLGSRIDRETTTSTLMYEKKSTTATFVSVIEDTTNRVQDYTHAVRINATATLPGFNSTVFYTTTTPTLIFADVDTTVTLVSGQDTTPTHTTKPSAPRQDSLADNLTSTIGYNSSEVYLEVTEAGNQFEDINATLCTCPTCPSCFVEFTGVRLNVEDIGGIGAGMVILFLLVIALLIWRCPVVQRVSGRIRGGFSRSRSGGTGAKPKETRDAVDYDDQRQHYSGGEMGGNDEIIASRFAAAGNRQPLTSRIDGGRYVNEYAQPNSTLAYAVPIIRLDVPRNRERRASVVILDTHTPGRDDPLADAVHLDRNQSSPILPHIENVDEFIGQHGDPAVDQALAPSGSSAVIAASGGSGGARMEVDGDGGGSSGVFQEVDLNASPDLSLGHADTVNGTNVLANTGPRNRMNQLLDSAQAKLPGLSTAAVNGGPRDGGPARQITSRATSMPSSGERVQTHHRQNFPLPRYENVSAVDERNDDESRNGQAQTRNSRPTKKTSRAPSSASPVRTRSDTTRRQNGPPSRRDNVPTADDRCVGI